MRAVTVRPGIANSVALAAVPEPAAGGVTGVSSGGRKFPFDVGAHNRNMVLQNHVVFGSVNANRRHYACGCSRRADPIERLVTRRVPLSRWQQAFARRPDDIKVALDFIL